MGVEHERVSFKSCEEDYDDDEKWLTLDCWWIYTLCDSNLV